MKLSFDEIKDESRFESLVTAYFGNLKTHKSAISQISVQSAGVGANSGWNLLVHTSTRDVIPLSFNRTWVVRCKFQKADISTNKIADINIPTLIHAHKAVGYLLVCNQRPTLKLIQLFNRLEKECTFGYRYQIISGEQLLLQLTSFEDNEPIIRQFFPKYYAYCIKNNV
jgi:hypothetical protein